jgi:2-polyprenyl-3-methyl-5-hydroxy-6-metoxy-1,4-benzoquinol methylase
MADTDWKHLWHDLTEKFRALPKPSGGDVADRWAKRAHSQGYYGDRRKDDRDDPLMQFMLSRLQPDDTVLDIGAGIGRWSIPMAKVCKKVTALDALPGMLEILRENAAAEKVTNIHPVVGDWETADVESHDHILSSHAAYTSPDIVGYALTLSWKSRGGSGITRPWTTRWSVPSDTSVFLPMNMMA